MYLSNESCLFQGEPGLPGPIGTTGFPGQKVTSKICYSLHLDTVDNYDQNCQNGVNCTKILALHFFR